MLLKVNTPSVSCCDVKSIAGANVRIGRKGNQCIVLSRYGKPPSPTPSQAIRRTTFKSLIDLWVGFSSSEKNAWADFAALQPLLNSCGETFFESGYQWFAKINGVLINFGVDKMLSAPPADYDPPGSSIALSLSYSTFCFFPVPVLTGSFTPVAGLGLEVFGFVGRASSAEVFALKSNMLFASVTEDDPIYGTPPDPGIEPSTLKLWFLALRLAWHFVFRPIRGAAQPPSL